MYIYNRVLRKWQSYLGVRSKNCYVHSQQLEIFTFKHYLTYLHNS